jgi:hypothetical protein
VVVGVIGKETSAHQLIIRTNFLAVGCTQWAALWESVDLFLELCSLT